MVSAIDLGRKEELARPKFMVSDGNLQEDTSVKCPNSEKDSSA